jgi:hypothetical protein
VSVGLVKKRGLRFVEGGPYFVKEWRRYSCACMLLMKVVSIVEKLVLVCRVVMKPVVYIFLFVPVLEEVRGMLCYFMWVNNPFAPFLEHVKHGA